VSTGSSTRVRSHEKRRQARLKHSLDARPALESRARRAVCFMDPSDEFDSGVPIRIPVTNVFDLHSVPPRDVKGVVEEYLAEALRLGFTALRIIHGRGIGTQREIVRGILARTPFVTDYRDAPLEAGGRGATVVTLTR
jgi:hypothetical protein